MIKGNLIQNMETNDTLWLSIQDINITACSTKGQFSERRTLNQFNNFY